MAKSKGQEKKTVYDFTTLGIILYFFYRLALLLVPTWSRGICLLRLGVKACLLIVIVLILLGKLWSDK